MVYIVVLLFLFLIEVWFISLIPDHIVPWIGIIIGELIWNAAWTILNRIFLFHFIMGFLIVLLIIIHIILLHSLTSSNPFNNNNSLIISFSPIIFKDVFISFLLVVIISIFLYYEPDIIGSSDNQIIANPLITPNNILPEWYFLIWYSILRCYPSKTVGVMFVVVLLMSLLY